MSVAGQKATTQTQVSVFSRKRNMKCYDPRDPAQALLDQSTWKETKNTALMVAREGMFIQTIDWELVKRFANYCDQTVKEDEA